MSSATNISCVILDPTDQEAYKKFFRAVPVSQTIPQPDGSVEIDDELIPPPMPGAVMFRHNDDGNVNRMMFHCPGCGAICGVNFLPNDHNEPVWELILQEGVPGIKSLDSLRVTITPSIWHKDAECNWHGYLTNSVWHSV